jgi:hypothetical protein
MTDFGTWPLTVELLKFIECLQDAPRSQIAA